MIDTPLNPLSSKTGPVSITGDFTTSTFTSPSDVSLRCGHCYMGDRLERGLMLEFQKAAKS